MFLLPDTLPIHILSRPSVQSTAFSASPSRVSAALPSGVSTTSSSPSPCRVFGRRFRCAHRDHAPSGVSGAGFFFALEEHRQVRMVFIPCRIYVGEPSRGCLAGRPAQQTRLRSGRRIWQRRTRRLSTPLLQVVPLNSAGTRPTSPRTMCVVAHLMWM